MAVHDLVLSCPHCGKRNDAHQNADRGDRHGPGEGSLSVCAACKGVAVFTAAGSGRGSSGRSLKRAGLVLRKPTPQEAAEWLRDEEFRELMREAAGLSPAVLRRQVPYVWS